MMKAHAMAVISLLTPAQVSGVSARETLDRGLVAIRTADGAVFLSWRLLKDDPEGVALAAASQTTGRHYPAQLGMR
ncbi:MAG TPA: hypothetical protein VLI39_08230 [Sedimentisphaerales bacterium]|nr:hypothetical protein [Sedimentisphaerales bacterium]